MQKLLAFINRHKTKLSGLSLVVVGALQTNATALQALLTPRQFAWFTVGAGLFVGVLGFLNSRAPK